MSVSSAALLTFSWYFGLSFLIFFGFVPLLFMEHYFNHPESPAKRKFGWYYLTFLLWNLGVTWWVVYASFGGALMAFLFNSLLMATVFSIFSWIKRKAGHANAVWLLIPIWIAWEHIHTLWDITWTWLTLGNVFAFHHNWVQWYEFTGTSGGTAWILAVNIFIFKTILAGNARKIWSRPVLKIAAAIVLPVLSSWIILFAENSSGDNDKIQPVKLVVVQPNIDPYSEKFYTAYLDQFNKVLNLVKGKINFETDYLVLPETFITGIRDDLNEEELNELPEIQLFRDSLINKFPRLRVICGANTYRFYHNDADITSTSRLDQNSGLHYDVFNTGIFITATDCEYYHKSKLVPGVEKMPWPWLLKPLEKLAINMGGTFGSLGTQPDRSVFHDKDMDLRIAPVICYESVYADYVAQYTRLGANMICIITNDGWWDDTPGYKQHLNYARLRAIENRLPIARSANTGVSCFIDSYGNISQATDWWQPAVISAGVKPGFGLTFFARFGDLISYCCVVLSLLLLGYSAIFRRKS